MLPTGGDWPCDGEIDIMEQWGNNYLTNNTTKEAILVIVRIVNQLILMKIFLHIFQMVLIDEFHKYSVIWNEDTIKWFVDEIETFRITPSSFKSSIPNKNTWPFNDGNWYIMINLKQSHKEVQILILFFLII